jgi:4-coumarate--CoA ligase
MFHVSNVPRAHTSPLRGGMKTYVMRRFELKSWMRNIEHFQITHGDPSHKLPPEQEVLARLHP